MSNASTATDTRTDAYLVCNARYHDTNYARLELLKLLGEHADIWTHVGADFSDIDTINRCQLLVTYTCDLCPTPAEQAGLQRFLDGGGRWIALHATNALLEFVNGKADTPDNAPDFMRMLGSRFVAHPPIQKFRVEVAAPEHPLVAGIEPFEAEDEPYYCEYFGDNLVLLDAAYDTPSDGYVQRTFGTDVARHPQMYLHPAGAGAVLYLALGHCCGKYDMRPLLDVAPVVRGTWEQPAYRELLRRGIKWGMRGLG